MNFISSFPIWILCLSFSCLITVELLILYYWIAVVRLGDLCLVPDFIRKTISFSGEDNGTPLQYSCLENPMDGGAWCCSPWGLESDTTEQLRFQFSLSSLEKEMAPHSSVLAWRIPGMAEPGGLPSMGSHRVGHLDETDPIEVWTVHITQNDFHNQTLTLSTCPRILIHPNHYGSWSALLLWYHL